ncbi:MAG: hypothetical protein GF353_11560 [Candidatus Lokiarchaeota archaeon]|nr:hypothetical protein [Candidatus Lokiarchaeota archaeon]
MNFNKIKSKTKPIHLDQNTSLLNFIIEESKELSGDVFLILYNHNSIEIGLIHNNIIENINPKLLSTNLVKEFRVFSENGELYGWKQNNQLKYRFRIDDKNGEDAEVYDEYHYMWGNKINDNNTIFEENRGMEMRLPFSVNNISLPLKFKVRNYYHFDENRIIQFHDARLIHFADSNGKAINIERKEA